MSLIENFLNLKSQIPENVSLIAVSKMQPIEKIKQIYNLGQRAFGENKVQELLVKKNQLPSDVNWHLIGHLQTNKVKQIIDFVDLIHSVDSLKLVEEIQHQAEKRNLKIKVLLQVKIAKEEEKYGFSKEEILKLNDEKYFVNKFPNVIFKGLMGMATFTDNQVQIQEEFSSLKTIFEILKPNFEDFSTLSMGMSGDFALAIQNGSTMIRVGSTIFKS